MGSNDSPEQQIQQHEKPDADAENISVQRDLHAIRHTLIARAWLCPLLLLYKKKAIRHFYLNLCSFSFSHCLYNFPMARARLMIMVVFLLLLLEMEMFTGSLTTGVEAIDCPSNCARRCSKARHNVCNRDCLACCHHCNCVPPGTSGNKEVCPCYANLKNRKGRPKCP